MRVLVIEDDHQVALMLSEYIAAEGGVATVVGTGREGLAVARDEVHDAIVLDVVLPDKNGLEVAAELRAERVLTPILMLTSYHTEEDIVRGLDAGADDYMSKPFRPAEFQARLRALLRRAGEGVEVVLRFADVELDQLRNLVYRDGVRIRLTPIEFRLLRALMSRPGETRTRESLLREVWGIEFDPGSNMVDVHVSRLRSKLGAGSRTKLIQAVRGQGFRLGPASQR